MRGETVTVIRQDSTHTDPFGAPIVQRVEEKVTNVLIAPGSEQNSTDSTHPQGITVAYTLYFPRTWNFHSLRGCLIKIDGQEYGVIADPRPYNGGVAPTQWNLAVQVSDTRG